MKEEYLIDRTGLQEDGMWKLIPYDRKTGVVTTGLVIITKENDVSYNVVGEWFDKEVSS